MIGFVPEPYPDELLYSLFARYYVRSGYNKYVFAAEELFANRAVRPSFEFFPALKKGVIEQLTKEITLEEIVYKHTMFPYYCRFLPEERKRAALDALLRMDSGYNNIVLLPKRKTIATMRYCPECVSSDRMVYGETFWHRIHQIKELSICPVHHCKIINTDFLLSGKTSPNLIPADIVIPQMLDVNTCENKRINSLAQYTESIFEMPLKMEDDLSVPCIIKKKTDNTEYRSARGGVCRITELYSDFAECYSGVINDLPKQWQIHKVITGQRYDFWEVCLLCFFLNISINELGEVVKEERGSQEIFDDKIAELHNKGFSYPKIAELIGYSVDIIKNAAYSKSKQTKPRKRRGGKPGRRPIDWESMDREILPKVVETIAELKSSEKPVRITLGGVARLVGLKSKQIDKLPLYKAEIEKYCQSQEVFWAEKVVWAWKELSKEGRSISIKQIRLKTNMSIEQIKRCVNELRIKNLEICDEILKLLNTRSVIK